MFQLQTLILIEAEHLDTINIHLHLEDLINNNSETKTKASGGSDVKGSDYSAGKERYNKLNSKSVDICSKVSVGEGLHFCNDAIYTHEVAKNTLSLTDSRQKN